MTNEEKQLLHKVVCAMLPYGVYCWIRYKSRNKVVEECKRLEGTFFDDSECQFRSESGLDYSSDYKPYLRRLSSMTEKEKKEWMAFTHIQVWVFLESLDKAVDWLNAHHFDYRGLIDKGLAFEAPEEMYKTE